MKSSAFWLGVCLFLIVVVALALFPDARLGIALVLFALALSWALRELGR